MSALTRLQEKRRARVIKGRRVYDPLTNTWSTGYWVAIQYGSEGNTIGKYYVPVW